jgi:hypothetical protein
MMELKVGDNVRTDSGEIGKVFHIDRLTVFVAFPVPAQADRISAFLESHLMKLGPPDEGGAVEIPRAPDS